jgi:hypothetical protein
MISAVSGEGNLVFPITGKRAASYLNRYRKGSATLRGIC